MLFDVSDLTPTSVPADLCIVGAGPAGLVVAAALRDSGRRIVVLESGGATAEPFAQGLNQGRVVGASYAGLTSTRQRQVGGTARLWNTPVTDGAGAKYVPLEPHDFEPLPSVPWSGWPFGARELAPYYLRAQEVCGLGPFQYEGTRWGRPDRSPLHAGSTPLLTGVYQFGSARRFIDRMVEDLVAAENVTIYCGATVVTLLTSDQSGGQVTGLVAVTREGTPINVQPRWVVLAGGAIENARLLLLARDRQAGMDPGDWLGRCFMEHPRDFSTSLFFPGSDKIG
ncbi:MAG TPA: FAD-binding protein, partial [Gemmatimonadales bacterium]